ncbi:MAG: trypsin-like peptidase domain-containing protein [Planctomycetes bacterium]|jgi:S1-C subfamily serine protease|nr:trypsin-like peptidase domain-containing protein [Planctomycetota bacterium]MCL4731492.1 trypsin-like peptidase domain-containing protein [Planctomycetota bacterium]
MATLAAFSRELEELASRTAPGVVSVEHGRGHGSGFVLAADGYVLTNAHVVDGAEKVRISFEDGSHAEASVAGRDERTDLAVVRVPGTGLPALKLAPADSVRVGQLALAIGNPLGFQRSVALGVVSAVDRTLGGRRQLFEGLIQTDAAINPGNSGGPLVNMAGEVIGVNTAIIPFAQGIGFAVPAQTASWVAAILIRDGRVSRPVLGVFGAGVELGAQQRAEAGADRALRVFRVAEDGAARKADIREGDLLLRANDQPLRTVDDLSRAMVLGGGAEMRITLLREGMPLVRAVTPAPAGA